jgi:hypothetical protein
MKTVHVVLVLGLALGACRNAGTAAVPAAAGERQALVAQDGDRVAAAAPAPGGAGEGGSGPVSPVPVVPVPLTRKIVRNGTINLEVADLVKAVASVRAGTSAAGGYVTNESQGRDEYGVRQGSITCRIPAEKLDATLAAFQALGRVQAVAVTADDITEQYFNLEIRLRNQQQLETRLLKLLDQPGNKVADLIEVEREVARVRSEIDELEGRKRLWDSQVALSTLTVELREPRPVIAGGGGVVWDTLKQAFRSAGENLVGTVAWFIAAAGVVVPAVLVLWVLWRVVKAIRSRRARR